MVRQKRANDVSPRRDHGQSVVEFAVILPVVLLLLVAIADFGRLYTSAVAVESSAREAADFGAFDTSYWDATLICPFGTNVDCTVAEMERRACTAAAGSHLEGYETTDPVDNTTCLNPTFSCTLELGADSVDCAASGGYVGTTNCSDPASEPPCTVYVRMDYDFRMFLSFPPLPGTVSITRESRFRISNLAPLP